MRSLKDILPPDGITTRLDGWLGDPECIPHEVARAIRRNMPSISNDDSIGAIRARMWRRQRAYESGRLVHPRRAGRWRMWND